LIKRLVDPETNDRSSIFQHRLDSLAIKFGAGFYPQFPLNVLAMGVDSVGAQEKLIGNSTRA
jgi:hypothetical protein